jgi:hypothetical protein
MPAKAGLRATSGTGGRLFKSGDVIFATDGPLGAAE